MLRSVTLILLALAAGMVSSAASAQPDYHRGYRPVRHYYHHRHVVVVHRDVVIRR